MKALFNVLVSVSFIIIQQYESSLVYWDLLSPVLKYLADICLHVVSIYLTVFLFVANLYILVNILDSFTALPLKIMKARSFLPVIFPPKRTVWYSFSFPTETTFTLLVPLTSIVLSLLPSVGNDVSSKLKTNLS